MTVLTRDRCVALPAPVHDGGVSFEKALFLRRSTRDFSSRALRLFQLAQLLWATQGLTDLGGRRSTPSAGLAYPLEVHVLTGMVEGLVPSHYRYLPRRHLLLDLGSGDQREALARAARAQDWIAHAAAILVVTAVPERTTFTYGERGTRFVQQEAGCAAQNLQLQAVALGLASAVVGTFDEREVSRLLGLPAWEHPISLLPTGYAAASRGAPC